MSITARISLPGIDALSSSDPRDFSLFADSDNILIKEKARGTVSINNGYNTTIAHNLGYLPHFYVYGPLASGKVEVINGYNIYGDWLAYADTTNLYIGNRSGATRTATYFIFYDNY